MNKELRQLAVLTAGALAQFSSILLAWGEQAEGETAAAPAATEAPKRTRAPRKPKEEPKAEPVEDESDELEDGDEAEAEEEFDETPEEDEEEYVSEEQVSKLKAALSKYSTAKSKKDALKILMKYAKTSAQVKKADFAKLVKDLKV